jgi:hypothetical protein
MSYQAEIAIPQLKESPGKELCFINIGGGAASDNINAVILILEENQSLLNERKIEINLLEVDSDSPDFAKSCIEALKASEGHFHNLDITLKHIKYNWANTEELVNILSAKKDSIMMCTSEGGLFEYGSDGEIISNLNSIYDNSPDDTRISATLIHDRDTVDPTIPAMANMTGGAIRFLGKEGLKKILEKTKWQLENMSNKNPVYVVFTLKKAY